MHWQATKTIKILILNSLLINGLSINSIYSSPLPKSFDNSYLSSYNSQSFFETNLPHQTIELDNIDEELLNATLFFYINKKRTKGRKKDFILNESLFESCKSIVAKYSGNTLNKLNASNKSNRKKRKNKKRLEKILKAHSKTKGFRGMFVAAEMSYLPIMNLSRNEKYFFDEELNDGDNVFFLGKKNIKKKNPKPVNSHTYLSFIEMVLKSQSWTAISKIRGKQYSELGCHIQVIQKSKKKIPLVKIIWMVGGYRLNLLEPS